MPVTWREKNTIKYVHKLQRQIHEEKAHTYNTRKFHLVFCFKINLKELRDSVVLASMVEQINFSASQVVSRSRGVRTNRKLRAEEG